jgi:hypothetical protein
MSMTGTNPDGSLRKRMDQLARAVFAHGRQDQDKHNIGGSRPELWRTPNAHIIEAKKDGIKLKGRTPKDPQVGLADQVKAEKLDGITPPTAEQLSAEEMKMYSSKLNPRWVETLMGLPVGWVMPSCTSPVTIEPTN